MASVIFSCNTLSSMPSNRFIVSPNSLLSLTFSITIKRMIFKYFQMVCWVWVETPSQQYNFLKSTRGMKSTLTLSLGFSCVLKMSSFWHIISKKRSGYIFRQYIYKSFHPSFDVSSPYIHHIWACSGNVVFKSAVNSFMTGMKLSGSSIVGCESMII